MSGLQCKVLVVGPPGCGKTVLCKYVFGRDPDQLAFLEGQQQQDEKEWESLKLDLGSESTDVPTYPVRIHERDLDNFQLSSGSVVSARVQLWDISGDLERMRDKLEALALHSHGLVLVYNPGKPGHGPLLDQWYKELEELLPSSVEKVLYPYKLPDTRSGGRGGGMGGGQQQQQQPPKSTGRIRCVEDCNTFEKDSVLRMHNEFDVVLKKIFDRIVSRRDKQERSIINS